MMAQLTSDDLLTALKPTLQADAVKKDVLNTPQQLTSDAVLSKLNLTPDSDTSFMAGIKNGIMETGREYRGLAEGAVQVIAGPIQFGLERVAPETAQHFTDWVNKETSGSGESGEEMGKSLGALPVLAASGLNKLGAMVSGGVMGGISYQEKPQALMDRGIEAAEGTVAGMIPGAVGAILKKGIKTAGETKVIQDFIASSKKRVEDLEPILSKLNKHIDDFFSIQKKSVSDVYSSRDAAGIAEVAPKAMVQKFDQLVTKLGNASVDEKVAGTISKIAERLNIPATKEIQAKNQQLLAQHTAAVSEYNDIINKKYAAFSKYVDDANKATGSNTPPMSIEDFINASKQERSPLPKPPIPPKLEAPPKTRLTDVFAALTTANADLGRGSNAAKTNQLSQVKSFLMDLVDDSTHLDPAKAKLLMDRASGEYKDKILPTRKVFGYKPFEASATGHRTNGEVLKFATRAIESKDPAIAENFATIIGPEGKKTLGGLALSNAVESAREGINTDNETINPYKMYQYLTKNRNVLSKVLPKEDYDSMLGFSKLAGVPHVRITPGGHSKAGNVLLLFAGERLLEGDVKNAGRLGLAFLGTKVAVKTFQTLNSIPGAKMLMRKASRYPAGSKELDSILKKITTIANSSGAVAGGETAKALGNPFGDNQ